MVFCFKRVITFVLFCLVFDESPSFAASVEKKSIAVLDFSANNVPVSHAKIVRNALEVALFNSDRFRLLEREQIETILRERKIKKNDPRDADNSIEIGKTIATDFVITGSVDKIGRPSITVRVVSVEEGRILFAYSRNLDSETEYDAAIRRITKTLIRDVRRYVKYGKTGDSLESLTDVYMLARVGYAYPLGRLRDIVVPGYGGVLETGVHNYALRNSNLGFEVGVYQFHGRENGADRCTFVPVLLDLSYRLSLLSRVYMLPVLGAGANTVILKHGAGEGFNIRENSTKTTIEPLAKAGLFLGVAPVDFLHLQIGADLGVVFERPRTLMFLSLSFGVQAVF